jgi:hypothetical protein
MGGSGMGISMGRDLVACRLPNGAGMLGTAQAGQQRSRGMGGKAGGPGRRAWEVRAWGQAWRPGHGRPGHGGQA